jgi:hypothetical protein
MSASSGWSQIEFGLKAGLSSYDLAGKGFSTTVGDKEIIWDLENARYGHHFGLYGRFRILAVYLEPALMFHSNSMTYSIQEYSNQQLIGKTVRQATYRQLDIPVLAGLKFGFFRMQAGPVGHFFINNLSDLTQTSTYAEKLDNSTLSWLAGVGLDIWRLRVDLNYEGGLHRFGENVTFAGQTVSFSEKPSRLLLTLGFRL